MNWWRKIINKLFLVFTENPLTKETKSINEFDQVWVKIDDIIYTGFIYEKTRRRILVTYFTESSGYKEIWFPFIKGSKSQIIKDNNITLFLEKPCYTD